MFEHFAMSEAQDRISVGREELVALPHGEVVDVLPAWPLPPELESAETAIEKALPCLPFGGRLVASQLRATPARSAREDDETGHTATDLAKRCVRAGTPLRSRRGDGGEAAIPMTGAPNGDASGVSAFSFPDYVFHGDGESYDRCVRGDRRVDRAWTRSPGSVSSHREVAWQTTRKSPMYLMIAQRYRHLRECRLRSRSVLARSSQYSFA